MSGLWKASLKNKLYSVGLRFFLGDSGIMVLHSLHLFRRRVLKRGLGVTEVGVALTI